VIFVRFVVQTPTFVPDLISPQDANDTKLGKKIWKIFFISFVVFVSFVVSHPFRFFSGSDALG
jgi:hypothetical protein